MRRVTFEVFGLARAKGNAKAFVPKGWKRAVVTTDDAHSKNWQQLVSDAAQHVAADGLFLGPVVLTVQFYLPRPQSLPKAIQHHAKKPDIDKLARNVLDALTHILYRDDSQIVDLRASKTYAAMDVPPHAIVTLEDAAPLSHPQSLFTEGPIHAEIT